MHSSSSTPLQGSGADKEKPKTIQPQKNRPSARNPCLIPQHYRLASKSRCKAVAFSAKSSLELLEIMP